MNEKKIRSPRESIESENSHIETAFIKFPGQELIKVSLPISDGARQALYDQKKIDDLVRKYGKEYMDIHTHVLSESAPSQQDISSFLDSKSAKTMVVASVDENSGKLQGYFILRKRRKDSKEHLTYKNELKSQEGNLAKNAEWKKAYKSREEQINQRSKHWYWRALAELGFVDFRITNDNSNFIYPIPKSSREERKEGLKLYAKNMYAGRQENAVRLLSKRYNLQNKIIPAEGFELIEGRFRKKQKKGLEEKVAVMTTIAGLAAGLFILSANITGNAIADLSVKSSSFLGTGLFIIGIVACFIWLRNRKK